MTKRQPQKGHANKELNRLINALCETPARSIEGLIAKARAADSLKASDDDLAWSIVDDLLAMKAVQS